MERLETIRQDLSGSQIELCPERAYLITEFFKRHNDRSEPVVVQKAHALSYLLGGLRGSSLGMWGQISISVESSGT